MPRYLKVSVPTLSIAPSANRSPGVVLIETFYRLAKRDVILRCVERKAIDINHMFMRLIASMRSEFETSRLNPPLRLFEPQYAGSALWANSLGVIVRNDYDYLVRYVLMPLIVCCLWTSSRFFLHTQPQLEMLRRPRQQSTRHPPLNLALTLVQTALHPSRPRLQ